MAPFDNMISAARAMLLVAGAGLIAGAGAGPLAEPHLRPVPRTGAEAARIAAAIGAPAGFDAAEAYEALPAGAATLRGGADFASPAPGIADARRMEFELGKALFEKLWVAAPSATRASDGLGPLFNARSCAGCHPGNARMPIPEAGAENTGLVLKLSRSAPAVDAPAIAGWHPTMPDPALGRQVQDRSLPGLPIEGRLRVAHDEIAVPLSGGETAMLRAPRYGLERAGDGAGQGDDPGLMQSVRQAPQLIGLGLLEAIPAADLLAAADPEDADGDGISGRAAVVWSAAHGQAMLGRFGYKAGAATLRDMAAMAFADDLGLSSPLRPDPWGDCTPAQAACLALPSGEDAGLRDGREVSGEALDLVAFYTASLAVPERRAPGDPEVLAGKRAFHAAGCTACHTPRHVTHRLPDSPERSFQLIWPYSDLLLHDMGPGLADGRPEGLATGREWRTAPLWGIGLNDAMRAGGVGYLHDGRARTLLEAILWHGGEARPARDKVAAMPPETRAALIRFLESL